jgi:hypothetical protein
MKFTKYIIKNKGLTSTLFYTSVSKIRRDTKAPLTRERYHRWLSA